jgi:hypothetical protein
VLAEACATAGCDTGVVRVTAAESSEEIDRYRDRVQAMEEAR